MKNAANWFELPTADLERARRFYEVVLGLKLKQEVFGGIPMAIFPYQDGVGGALLRDDRYRPSPDGAVVYLDATGALDACLARVAAAGGKVVVPRTDIGEPGFIALVIDTEGNRVGLHDPVRPGR
jgi:predicted enzyme related to lactoylglutathione lyase